MAQTAAARAIDVFVSAVEAHGGKAEVVTKGISTLVTVTATDSDASTTLRVKGTTEDSWQARKSETTPKAPVTAWALVDLSDGAPIALVSATDYAAHVRTLVTAWEGKNPEKTLGTNTTLPVTAEAVAAWEDDWALLGLGAASAPAAATPAAKSAAPKAPKTAPTKAPAKKAPAKAPAKKAAAKAPAKKAAAKAPANTAPAKKAPAKKAPAKKAPAKKAPVKASEAKITPISEQKEAATKGRTPSSVPTNGTSPTKTAAQATAPATAPGTKTPAAKQAPKKVAKPKKGLLQRLPVVGRLL